MKRFEVRFNVERPEGRREVTINTDELDALSQSTWFREYIGLKDMLQAQALQQQVTELRAALVDARSQPMQPVMSLPQQSVQAPQQLQPQPQPQRQAPQRRPGYLDVAPDAMTEATWLTLSDEQRQQWMRHWGIQQ